uniref:Ribosomal RNA-processing protein 8 n=1 Tax=Nothoprocta perdicaria TaxID=30464 RepID=A0A8C6ZMK0_NOTPE
ASEEEPRLSEHWAAWAALRAGLRRPGRRSRALPQVPLAAESVDVAVFCLSLMGTNLQEILEEANRVLKQGGTLLLAEVASRFTDLRAFLGALARLGFRCVSKVREERGARLGPHRVPPAAPCLVRPCAQCRRLSHRS